MNKPLFLTDFAHKIRNGIVGFVFSGVVFSALLVPVGCVMRRLGWGRLCRMALYFNLKTSARFPLLKPIPPGHTPAEMERVMCGIVGMVVANPAPQVALQAQLAAMAARLVHRGPDAEGFYCQGAVGLGHRRLSIIDLAGGAQPMQTADGNLCVTFNGEIFNFIELRQALEQKGYSFSTHSDTEVILHLYREYGLDFPNKLNGQFAIGLWDVQKQQLILVRDRVGICPLYYYFDNERLVFASEIKALAPALPHAFTLNIQALDDIFTGWTCLPPDTIFNGIWQVQPGEMLVVNGPQNITRQFYWQLNYPQNAHEYDLRTEGELVEELHYLLSDATAIRLRADVPIGAYLSGGLDSSVLVALMHQQIKDQLHTFSLGFNDPALDERN
jgi:asparagine synthase (glutamine-hydrolysing)